MQRRWWLRILPGTKQTKPRALGRLNGVVDSRGNCGAWVMTHLEHWSLVHHVANDLHTQTLHVCHV